MTHSGSIHEGFAREIDALGRELRDNVGDADFAHLKTVERWGRACTALGYATAWLAPNPVSIALLGLGLTGRLLVGHHITHRSYDRIPGIPARYTSKGFAHGRRRFLDWFDWWSPRSWRYMHNTLHHANTGGPDDADLLDPDMFRRIPMAARYGILALFACTWKFSYYAPYMAQEWRLREMGVARTSPYVFTPADVIDARRPDVRRLWRESYLPYVAFHFVAVPLLFAPLGRWAVFSVFCNAVLGEIFANVQGFITIRSSHSAADIPIFKERHLGKDDYYLRQVLGTVNYRNGDPLTDFLHLWTNYQIEHHLFPDLPLLKYRECAPRVRQICAKYGVRYGQEPVMRRFRKMTAIYVGKARQPVIVTRDLYARPRRPRPAAIGPTG